MILKLKSKTVPLIPSNFWRQENNINENKYYYWLRRVKEAALTAFAHSLSII